MFGSYEDGTIIQWNFVNSGEIVKEFMGHSKRISSLALIPDKKLLVSASHDATIRTWNTETGEPVSVYKTSGPVHLMRIGSDEPNIHAIVNRNIFYEINTSNNSIIKCIRFDKHSLTSFIYKDNILVFGNIENKVLVYDLSEFDPESSEVIMC